MDALERAAALLTDKHRILLFTGAGISTESGIPDFRGPDGVWTRVDPAEFTIDRYLTNRDTRIKAWEARRSSGALTAAPNAGHDAVVRMWRTGRLVGCVTQNIDGLHQAAGLPDEAIAELHGNARRTRCLTCGHAAETSAVVADLRPGEEPTCSSCGGMVKADIVMFGEMLPERETTKAFDMATRADSVIAVGSTLSVYPAANVPIEVVKAGHPMIIINRGATELDGLASVRIEAGAGETLEALADALER